MSRYVSSAEAKRAKSKSQRTIRRSCKCGRIIIGNAAWWSHTHHKDGTEREGHIFWGRA